MQNCIFFQIQTTGRGNCTTCCYRQYFHNTISHVVCPSYCSAAADNEQAPGAQNQHLYKLFHHPSAHMWEALTQSYFKRANVSRRPFASLPLMLCCKTKCLAMPTDGTTVYGESHTVWNTMGTESKAKNMPEPSVGSPVIFWCCSGNKELMCWTVLLRPLIHSLAKINRAALTPSPPLLPELKPRLSVKIRLLAKAVTSWNELSHPLAHVKYSTKQSDLKRCCWSCECSKLCL